MVEKEGIKFGIIGAIGDCYSSISSSMVEDYYFKVGSDLTNLVKQESNKLKEKGADFIIYIIHDGLDSFEANIANDNKQFNPTNHYDIKLSDGYVDLVLKDTAIKVMFMLINMEHIIYKVVVKTQAFPM